MPTNLPPEYFKIEENYRNAETQPEKIMYLEEMLAVIPKHKGTDHLRADLRRKLSRLKEAAQSRKGGSRHASPFQIEKEGAGQVAVIGAPNVGKSSLVRALTNAEPDIGDYPYTTQVPIPGMMRYENVQIQLIDTPPMSAEFEEPQLMHLIRLADLALLVLDLQGAAIQQYQDALALLAKFRIVPASCADQYEDDARITCVPLLIVVNKTDDAALDEDFHVLCELIEDKPCPFIPVSSGTARGLDDLRRRVFETLDLVRVYSQPPGKEPNFDQPFVMPRGGTVEDFAAKVHKDFVDSLRSARVWGAGVFDGQQVGRDHVLHDGDVVELKA
jgi:uncharacterized protein